MTPFEGEDGLDGTGGPGPLEAIRDALAPRYSVERLLGAGGMGVVYLGVDQELGRAVALKVMHAGLVADPLGVRHLHAEARAMARLDHPNIVPVYDVGEAHGLHFISMAYVPGRSLAEILDGPAIPIDITLHWFAQIASALAHAHAAGIVHRDLKPANILIDAEGDVRVTDFGIARMIGLARTTTPGHVIGTPAYMSPEHLTGEEVTAASDQFSLGVLTYEIIAGRAPFKLPLAVLGPGKQDSISRELRHARHDCPGAVAAAVARMLAPQPEERFASTLDAIEAMGAEPLPQRHPLRDQVRQLAGPHEPVAGRSPKTGARWRRSRWRVGRRHATRVVLLLVALAGAAVTAFLGLRPRAARYDPNLLLVAPFNVIGATPELREWLLELLSRDLDDQGVIRTVPPSQVQRWSEPIDRRNAAALAKQARAGLVLHGSITPAGKDSVTLTASILDVARDRTIGGGDLHVSGAARDVGELARSVTIAALEKLRTARQIGAFQRTGLASMPFNALKPFLDGERHYRRSAWDSAAQSYARALDEDSTFALAASRLGQIMRWRRGGGDAAAKDYLLQAGRFNHGLPRRDSILILSDSIRAQLISFEAEADYLSRARRVMDMLEAATEQYPEDAEFWYALGEAYYHHGHGPGGVTDAELLAVYRRAIALEPGFAPAYITAIEQALAAGDDAAARSFMRSYRALGPTDSDASGILLLEDLVARPALALARGVPADPVYVAWRTARHWPDSTGVALRLAEALQFVTPQANRRFYSARDREIYYTLQLAFAGRIGQAGARVDPQNFPRLYTELALLGGIPPATARAVFDGWVRDGAPAQWAALPWWASTRDTARIIGLRSAAEAALQRSSNPLARRDHRYRLLASEAYLELARADTARALQRFDALPGDLCLLCYYDRLTRARLLAARGRAPEAAAVLRERLAVMQTPVEALFALERGRVAERLGRNEEASAAYRWVTRAWSTGDAVLRPLVTEARHGLTRLRGP